MARTPEEEPNTPCEPSRTPRRVSASSGLPVGAFGGNRIFLIPADASEDGLDVKPKVVHSDDKPPVEPPEPAAERATVPPSKTHSEVFQERIEQATVLKSEAISSISSVFERVQSNESVSQEQVKSVVAPMIGDLMQDRRALLALVNLKNADEYTFTHSVNVAILTIALALRLCRPEQIEDIGVGALVHDIGKVNIPLDILHKPGTLSQSEMEVVRQHPAVGADILVRTGGFSGLAIAEVRDHHENIAGRGYPRGKKAGEISMHAQMTSIADIYDALTTDRPYRAALSPREASLLMSSKFSDSLDAALLREFFALVGYYPVGTPIQISNGCTGTVFSNDPNNPELPAWVQITAGPDGKPLPKPCLVDLRVQRNFTIKQTDSAEVLAQVNPVVAREYREFCAYA